MSGTRERQRAETKRVMLRESRRLFAAKGYADVALADIVQAAGVTKGALYHHFENKADLFRAVLEQVQHEVGAKVAATADAEDDLWNQFLAGCRAFLESGTDPGVRRIMLIDAPAVLGWTEWRRLDEATSARHLTEALTALIKAEVLAPQPPEPLARLLSGAMNEAALWLAESGQDLTTTWEALRRLLEAMRIDL